MGVHGGSRLIFGHGLFYSSGIELLSIGPGSARSSAFARRNCSLACAVTGNYWSALLSWPWSGPLLASVDYFLARLCAAGILGPNINVTKLFVCKTLCARGPVGSVGKPSTHCVKYTRLVFNSVYTGSLLAAVSRPWSGRCICSYVQLVSYPAYAGSLHAAYLRPWSGRWCHGVYDILPCYWIAGDISYLLPAIVL